jgi:hypothetical protein
MKTFYNFIYSVPALLLHEISHVVVAVLLGGKFNSFDIKKKTNGWSCTVNILGLNSNLKVKLVAMSPFLVPSVFLLLTIVNVSFLPLIVYSLSTPVFTFPSDTDYKVSNIKRPAFI